MDIGGLLSMLMGGKMGGGGGGGGGMMGMLGGLMGGGGGGMSGVQSGSSSTAPAPQPSMMSQIGQGMLDAQKGGWGYGAMNAMGQQQAGSQPVGEGAKDKELGSLLMLLKLLQGGGMTNGLGTGVNLAGPPAATRASAQAAVSPWRGTY
jgi:hypothetical protein